MDIMNIIEKYIELTRKRVAIMKNRGQYVGNAPFLRQLPHLEEVNVDEQDELSAILAEMDEIYKEYEAAIETISADALRDIYIQIATKFEDLKGQSDTLTKHKEWANREETTAFNTQNSVAEERYENICTSCTKALSEIRQILPYYRYFETDLRIRISRISESKKSKIV